MDSWIVVQSLGSKLHLVLFHHPRWWSSLTVCTKSVSLLIASQLLFISPCCHVLNINFWISFRVVVAWAALVKAIGREGRQFCPVLACHPITLHANGTEATINLDWKCLKLACFSTVLGRFTCLLRRWFLSRVEEPI